jgi:hypothetical protein
MLNFLCNDGWMSNHELLRKGHDEGARVMVYRCAGRIFRKIDITF